MEILGKSTVTKGAVPLYSLNFPDSNLFGLDDAFLARLVGVATSTIAFLKNVSSEPNMALIPIVPFVALFLLVFPVLLVPLEASFIIHSRPPLA